MKSIIILGLDVIFVTNFHRNLDTYLPRYRYLYRQSISKEIRLGLLHVSHDNCWVLSVRQNVVLLPQYFHRYYLRRCNSELGESVPKPKVFSGSTRRANPSTRIMLVTNAHTRRGLRKCVEKNYRRT